MTVSRREDRHLDCHLCGDVFIFSAGEQELLRLRGLERIPTRCPRCQRWSPGQQYLPKVALAH